MAGRMKRGGAADLPSPHPASPSSQRHWPIRGACDLTALGRLTTGPRAGRAGDRRAVGLAPAIPCGRPALPLRVWPVQRLAGSIRPGRAGAAAVAQPWRSRRGGLAGPATGGWISWPDGRRVGGVRTAGVLTCPGRRTAANPRKPWSVAMAVRSAFFRNRKKANAAANTAAEPCGNDDAMTTGRRPCVSGNRPVHLTFRPVVNHPMTAE